LKELKFQKALGDLIDTEIGLYLNDSQFIKGFLLDVKPDHIVVNENKTVFYFPLQHIRTISSNTKSLLVSTEIVHYINKEYLVDVLKSFRYYWVSINSLSDQGIFGVLSKVTDDYVTVINKSELLYIQKSHISTITSHIPEKRIILLNTQEQLAIPNSQIEEQVYSEHTKKTIEIETKTKTEVPILEMIAEEVTIDENIAIKRPKVHSQTRLEIYFTLVKLLKHNLSNRNMANELGENIIQGFHEISADEEKEQIEALVVENLQPINEAKSIKNTKVPKLEALAEEETEIGNTLQETTEDSSRFVSSDLLECDKEYLFETDHLGVLESNNRFSLEGKFYPTKSKEKRRKMLLSAWSTLNNEKESLTNANNHTTENELTDYGDGNIKQEESSDFDNLLVQPACDQYPNGNFGTLDEKRESIEVTTSQLPISPQDVKKILEKQYLSLMQHAETNVFLLAQRRLNQSEEAQYLALMKHAENMYRELKN